MNGPPRFVIRCITSTTLFAVTTAALGGNPQPLTKAYKINGPNGKLQCWKDPNTGLVWTETLGQVDSATGNADATAAINNLNSTPGNGTGWRLPKFEDLQTMYNTDKGQKPLRIANGLVDTYETDDANVLGNASGNGFQTKQTRLGIGKNWYIAVRP